MATVTETAEVKKGRSESPDYFETHDLPKETKLDGVPSDYVHGKYKKLSKSNFDKEQTYLEYQIAHHEARKAKIDADIDEVKKQLDALTRFENEAQRELYVKTVRAQKRLAKLMEELEGEDIDASEILESLNSDLS